MTQESMESSRRPVGGAFDVHSSSAMNRRRIVVCTALHSFSGGPGDRVQHHFLQSLAKQSNRNFLLCATNPVDQSVTDVLSRCEFDWVLQPSRDTGSLSISNMVELGTRHVEPGRSIFLLVQPHHVLDSDFLEELALRFEPGFSGTVYPQLVFDNVHDFEQERPLFHEWASPGVAGWNRFPLRDPELPDWLQLDPNRWTPDLAFVDGDVLLSDKRRERLAHYRVDSELTGLGQSVLVTMLAPPALRKNLFFHTRCARIQAVGKGQERSQRSSYFGSRSDGPRSSRLPLQSEEEYRSVLRRYSRDASLDLPELDDPLLARIRHVGRYQVSGSAAEQALYRMYLGFWTARYQISGPGRGDALFEPGPGGRVLRRMKQLIVEAYEQLSVESVRGEALVLQPVGGI